MDRIKNFGDRLSENYFSGLPSCHRERMSIGKHAHTVGFRNC